jgi:hypothetical protein
MPPASRSATLRAAVKVGKRAELYWSLKAEAAYSGLVAVRMTAPMAAPSSPTTAAVTMPSTEPVNPLVHRLCSPSTFADHFKIVGSILELIRTLVKLFGNNTTSPHNSRLPATHKIGVAAGGERRMVWPRGCEEDKSGRGEINERDFTGN